MSEKRLFNNEKALRMFRDSSSESQTLILERLSDDFRTGSPEMRNLVHNTVLLRTEDLPPTWGEVPMEALSNLGPSTLNFAKSMWQVASDPHKTIKSLVDIPIGLAQMLVPGEQDREKQVKAIWDFFVDRYGGEPNFRRTMAKDPFGFFTDIGGIFSGLGAGLKAAGLTRAGQMASRMGGVSPLEFTGRRLLKRATVTQEATPTVPAGTPTFPLSATSRIKTALKPSGTVGLGKGVTESLKLQNVDKLANEFIGLGLGKKGLRITRASIKKLNDDIKVIQKQIDDIVKEGERQGKRIRVDRVLSDLNDLADDIRSNPAIPIGEAKIIQKFIDEMKSKQPASAVLGRAEFTPTQLQRLKKILNKSYRPNVQEAVDAVRKVAKDRLRSTTMNILQSDEFFPQLRQLNANQKVMIQLQEAIAKRVRIFEEAKISPVTGLIAGGAGAGTATITGTTLGLTQGFGVGTGLITAGAFSVGSFVAAKILTDPNVQVAIARAINVANTVAARSGQLINPVTMQAVFQAGRIGRETETALPTPPQR